MTLADPFRPLFLWGSVSGKLLRWVFCSFLNVLEKRFMWGFISLCPSVKPSPSKKSRSGTAVPRRSCQGGVPSQLHMSCETKAQVTTEADVEQGWCLEKLTLQLVFV